MVRDIFTGGVRTFLSTADAQAFRSLIYKQYSELLRPLGSTTSTVLAHAPDCRVVDLKRNKLDYRYVNIDLVYIYKVTPDYHVWQVQICRHLSLASLFLA